MTIPFKAGVHYEVLREPVNGYKYKLLIPIRHFLTHYEHHGQAQVGEWVRLEHNRMTLAQDYHWNGPNVVPDWQSLMFSSLIHDAQCQLIAAGQLPYDPWKKYAAKEFRLQSKRHGRPLLLRWRDYLAVRYLGGKYTPYQPQGIH